MNQTKSESIIFQDLIWISLSKVKIDVSFITKDEVSSAMMIALGLLPKSRFYFFIIGGTLLFESLSLTTELGID